MGLCAFLFAISLYIFDRKGSSILDSADEGQEDDEDSESISDVEEKERKKYEPEEFPSQDTDVKEFNDEKRVPFKIVE